MNVSSLIASFKRKPYRNIFFWLMFVVVADALAPNYVSRGRFSDLALAALLFVAMVEAARTRQHGMWAMALGLPAIATRVVAAYRPDSLVLNTTVLLLSAVFMGFLVWAVLHDLRQGDRPTDERIYGALCAYVFIGLLFALAYTHMEYRDPGSFNIPEAQTSAGASGESNLFPVFSYFSFVTMTTLGFGDITPVSEHARAAVWFQALLGQLYLAVMVAGMVAVHVSESMREKLNESSTDDSG